MSNAVERLRAALSRSYRIERELGQGGMATVYLAQDLKHDRRVALKVLRPELAAVIGAERFLAEIKTTAALQHPHILPLFDSGHADSFLFYVMPFIEGEPLRDRLSRERQLPISDAVRIATEVASALDYAHRHGVIHRDIKPENILVHDGSALVADFGIALAVSQAGGTRMTETGMSLGTPHYMSPEQAMGEREITARSDVYALGCVLYEMLVGEPPFTGPSAQAIVAKVLTEEPRPMLPQRHTISSELEDAVLTALQKLPADRFGSASEFAAALAGGTTVRRTAGQRPRGRSTAVSPDRRAAWPILSAGALIIGALGLFIGSRLTLRSPLPLRFGQATKVTWDPGLEVQPALSPDGRSVAYASGTSFSMRIFVRAVAGGRSIPLTDDSAGVVQAEPQWSADGSRILFLARGGVMSAPAAGGPARPEVPAPGAGQIASAAWSPDGKTIAYAIADTLFLRDQSGSVRRLASFLEPASCAWSPNGTLIACASGNVLYVTVGVAFGNVSPSRIVVCRVADGTVTTVTDSLSLNQSPTWSPDGRRLFFVSNRNGPRDVYVEGIAPDGRPEGPLVRVTTGLGAQSISLSVDGRRMAYATLVLQANVWSVPIPAHPPVTFSQATQVTVGTQTIESATASMDGRWLLYDSDVSGNMDLYRMSLSSKIPERLTTDPSDEFSPELSPDGREVAFHSWRAGSRDIYVLPLDGSPAQAVTSSPRQEAIPDWSPDGQALVFYEFSPTGAIWIARRHDKKWDPPVRRLDRGFWPAWSPDGRTIAFTTGLLGGSIELIPSDSGAPHVLLDATRPGAVRAEQVRWAPQGGLIYFKGHDAVGNASFWSIPATGGVPRLLVRIDDPNHASYRGTWGLSHDRFYLTVEDRQSDVWVMEVERP